MEQLKGILGDETSKEKADYMDKLFVKLNRINTYFMIHLAWQLCKCYYKQAEPFTEISENSNFKKGVALNSKALEYYNWAVSTRQNSHPEFKSDSKFSELKKELQK